MEFSATGNLVTHKVINFDGKEYDKLVVEIDDQVYDLSYRGDKAKLSKLIKYNSYKFKIGVTSTQKFGVKLVILDVLTNA